MFRTLILAAFLTCGAGVARAQVTLEDVKVTSVGPTPISLDTVTRLHRATAACGRRRLCKKGWDIAALSIVGPRTGAAVGQAVVLRMSFTNLGRASAPQVPVLVSFAGATERVMTPELGAGDTVDMAVTVVPRDGDNTASLQVDPERLASDTYVDNNHAESGTITVEAHPTLELAETAIEKRSVRVGEPLRVRLRFRNASRVMALADLSAAFSSYSSSCVGESNPSIALPTLGAQQEMTVTFVVRGLTQQGNSMCHSPQHSVLYGAIKNDQGRDLLDFNNDDYMVNW